ncbi:hypothetical protein FKM82_012726 [Ascaphus truei]
MQVNYTVMEVKHQALLSCDESPLRNIFIVMSDTLLVSQPGCTICSLLLSDNSYSTIFYQSHQLPPFTYGIGILLEVSRGFMIKKC